jgi:hypothetical protein
MGGRRGSRRPGLVEEVAGWWPVEEEEHENDGKPVGKEEQENSSCCFFPCSCGQVSRVWRARERTFGK